MTAVPTITPLTAERYEAARQAAIAILKAKNPEPQPRDYLRKVTITRFPGWVNKLMLGGLLAVIFVGFYISAGKFIVSVDTVLTSVSSTRLSSLYDDGAILLSLIFGEMGSILFSLSASVLADKSTKLLGLEISLSEAVFRLFAVVCAAIALTANIGIALIHESSWASISAFGWLITIVPPAAILGCSLILEKMILTVIEARATAKAEYTAAVQAWRENPGRTRTAS